MSATTDRLAVAAQAAKAVADAAVAEAAAAQQMLDAQVALEQAEADRLAALEADAGVPGPAAAPEAAPGPRPLAAGEVGPPMNDLGPIQQSPEQLLAAEQAAATPAPELPPSGPALPAEAPTDPPVEETAADVNAPEAAG